MTQEEIEQILEADIQFAIADLWRQLASGEMTPADWRAQMGDLLAQYLTAAWILGEGGQGELIDPDGLRAYIEAQFAFLDNFASQLETAISERRLNGFVGVPGYEGYTVIVNEDGSITIVDASGNEVDGGNVFAGFRTLNGGRAGMYGDAMWGAYQTGKIVQIGAGTKYGLHLPAMPADGSSICKTRDRCAWLIIPINVDEGEYDAFWTLGQAEHCQTCVQRAAEWNPLHIWHGWPDYKVKSIKEKIEEIALKHRQGMHNQKRHGWRFGSLDKARRGLRAGVSSDVQDKVNPADERAAYRKRAGMPVPVKKPRVETESKAMTGVNEYSFVAVQKTPYDWQKNDHAKAPLLSGNRERALQYGIKELERIYKENGIESAGILPRIDNNTSSGSVNMKTRDAIHDASDFLRSELKDDICRRIDSRGIVNRALVSENLQQWAESSNNSAARSLVLQSAAAQAFGVELSVWQQGKKSAANKKHGELKPTEKDVLYWKEVYSETQSFFQKAGYKPDDEIILYRGIAGRGSRGKLTGKAKYEGNAVESWSFDVVVAHDFTGMFDGAIVSAKIKVKDIISTCFTGPGCLNEMEVIVLGSRPNQEVYIYDISE